MKTKSKNIQKERIAIVTALRTPMAKAGGKFARMQADQHSIENALPLLDCWWRWLRSFMGSLWSV